MTLSIENIPDEQRITVKFADYLMDDDAFYDFCCVKQRQLVLAVDSFRLTVCTKLFPPTDR